MKYLFILFLLLSIFSCEKPQDRCMYCKKVARDKATGQLINVVSYGEKACDNVLAYYKSLQPEYTETAVIKWECEKLTCVKCSQVLTDLKTGNIVSQGAEVETCNENIEIVKNTAPVIIQGVELKYQCH